MRASAGVGAELASKSKQQRSQSLLDRDPLAWTGRFSRMGETGFAEGLAPAAALLVAKGKGSFALQIPLVCALAVSLCCQQFEAGCFALRGHTLHPPASI